MYSILLVDDEPEILAAWSLILVNEGYRVTCASNGIEALERLKHHIPNLIITDWMMPLMDGLALCSQLKAQPALANVPVLFHSSASPPDILPRYWNVSLRKPAPAQLFLTTVGKLCRGDG